MEEIREIEIERQAIYTIPSWEWDENLDQVLESLAKRRLEILSSLNIAREEGKSNGN